MSDLISPIFYQIKVTFTGNILNAVKNFDIWYYQFPHATLTVEIEQQLTKLSLKMLNEGLVGPAIENLVLITTQILPNNTVSWSQMGIAYNWDRLISKQTKEY